MEYQSKQSDSKVTFETEEKDNVELNENSKESESKDQISEAPSEVKETEGEFAFLSPCNFDVLSYRLRLLFMRCRVIL